MAITVNEQLLADEWFMVLLPAIENTGYRIDLRKEFTKNVSFITTFIAARSQNWTKVAITVNEQLSSDEWFMVLLLAIDNTSYRLDLKEEFIPTFMAAK